MRSVYPREVYGSQFLRIVLPQEVSVATLYIVAALLTFQETSSNAVATPTRANAPAAVRFFSLPVVRPNALSAGTGSPECDQRDI